MIITPTFHMNLGKERSSNLTNIIQLTDDRAEMGDPGTVWLGAYDLDRYRCY